MKNKGFTLIELLVVVLIIGILVAIALPQYQKAVLKADLHRGVNLVESLYQAQQTYYLANGEFAKDIDDLDASIPKNSSCIKTQNTYSSAYNCDFGTISMTDEKSEILFIPTNRQNSYAVWLRNYDFRGILFKKDKRYCYAKPGSKLTDDICKNMGGTYFNESQYWTYYQLD